MTAPPGTVWENAQATPPALAKLATNAIASPAESSERGDADRPARPGRVAGDERLVSSPQDMRASIERNMLEKTGKPLDHWVAVVRAEGLSGHGPIVKYLMAEHGFTRGYAGAVAWACARRRSPPDELVEQQYAGKEALLPILDAVRKAIPPQGPRRERARRTSPGRTAASSRCCSRRRRRAPISGSCSRARRRPIGSARRGRSARDGSRIASRWRAPREVDAEVKRWLRDAFTAASR